MLKKNEALGPLCKPAQTSAKILIEALPYMQRYDRETVVIKYGGHAMGDAKLAECFAQDVVLLKQSGVNPIVVHGGGPQISSLLDKLKIKSVFKDGLRVTCKEAIKVVEMVLAGSINKQIVSAINAQGGNAVGISGKDANLMIARKYGQTITSPDSNGDPIIDLGYVGEPEQVNPHILDVMIGSDLIPVVAPIGMGRDGSTYNINADTFAGAVATTMKAKRLMMMTDVNGVFDKNKKLIEKMTIDEAHALIQDGTITGGMIPKIESCISVLESCVEAVVIINGQVPHAVLLELFTKHGAGTLLDKTSSSKPTRS